MIGQTENTAILATTFGSMLLLAQSESADEMLRREVAVLARVLEGRLREVRRQLADRGLASVADVRDLYGDETNLPMAANF